METIKKMLKWVGIDGLLHFLVCYAMMMTFAVLLNLTWAVFITTTASVTKEVIDFCIQKDNDESQVVHDVICDVIGIIGAIMILGL